MTRKQPDTVRFSILMFFFWATMIVVEGFLVPYLTGIGYSERQIGIVMASIFLPSVVTTPLWGYLADRTARHRGILIACLSVSVFAVLGIRLSGSAIGLAITCGLIYSLTLMSLPGLVDSWLMAFRRKGATITYGIARGFGSLGYSASGAVLGIVLQRFGLVHLFSIYAGLVVIVVVVIATMPGRTTDLTAEAGRGDEPDEPDRTDVAHDDPPGQSGLSPIRAVLSNRNYVIFIASTFLVFIGMRASMTFLALRFYELGGNTAHVGIAQSVYAGSEIPFMFLTALALRRWRPRGVVAVALFLFVIRLVVVRVAPTPLALVIAQALHGPSMGLLLPASVHLIDRIAPPEHRSLFQTLAPAVYFGLASVVGSSIGGVVVDVFGLNALYTSAPITAAAGAALFAAALVLGRAKRAVGTRGG